MQPGTRTVISLVPLVLQGLATLSGITAVSFFLPGVISFLKIHEGKFSVPAPTRLLVEHEVAAKLVVVSLFAISVVTFLVTRSKIKNEADQLAVQSAVYAAVWYLGFTYVGGVLMAVALPYFALNSP